MKQYNLFGYLVESDTEAIQNWYKKSEGWNCDCGHCKNFLLLAKEKKLPSAVLEILEKFDIPPEKPTYVCEILEEKEKLLYQFSYRMAGNIVKERTEESSALEWGEVYCRHEPYPYGASKFPKPHFDLEFWIRLPWVLKYTFSDIEDSLMHGRELEFSYKGRECAVTNHTKKWWFYDGVVQVEVCDFENFKLLVKKVAEYVVDDRTVRDIFDEGLYEGGFIL